MSFPWFPGSPASALHMTHYWESQESHSVLTKPSKMQKLLQFSLKVRAAQADRVPVTDKRISSLSLACGFTRGGCIQTSSTGWCISLSARGRASLSALSLCIPIKRDLNSDYQVSSGFVCRPNLVASQRYTVFTFQHCDNSPRQKVRWILPIHWAPCIGEEIYIDLKRKRNLLCCLNFFGTRCWQHINTES